MLSYFDLRKGVRFILDGQPYEVLEFSQMKKAQREGIAKTKIRNLISGRVLEKNFHQEETFEEAEIEKVEVKFLFSQPIRKPSVSNGASQEKFFFSEIADPSKRFELTEKQIGPGAKFLKPNQVLTGIKFQEKIINVVLPIKVQLKVIEAPPGVKGGRAEPGTKIVTLETGVKINVPLFIEEGDIIEVNTETGQYVRRAE